MAAALFASGVVRASWRGFGANVWFALWSVPPRGLCCARRLVYCPVRAAMLSSVLPVRRYTVHSSMGTAPWER